MAPPGRAQTASGVYAVDDLALLLPSQLVLDTSFLVEALIPSEPRHSACRDFLERLVEGQSVAYFNRLLELELAETAFKIALKERHGRGWRSARHDGRSRKRGTRLLHDVQTSWHQVLSALPWVRIEPAEVIDLVPDLMSRYGLSSYDAVHVATAVYTGVREFVTLDFGFAAVPRRLLNIHVDRSRSARFRSRRTH